MQLLHAWLAHALQSQQICLRAAGLMAVRRLDGTRAVMNVRRCLARDVARECLDGVHGDAAALRRPLRRFRDAFLILAEQVGLELIEAHRMGVDELLIVEPLGDHDVHHAEVECGVGVG